MPQTKLFLLASNSPRRRDLLSIAGFMFGIAAVDIDETPLPGEDPRDYVQRLSIGKAQAAHQKTQGKYLILAADTTVADGVQILGKPRSAGEARQMLEQLRGRAHQVHTGITLLDTETGEMIHEIATTNVPMRQYSDAEIDAYIASGDPFDKAGGYGIQNPDFRPVETRTGCYANVVGLPLCHLLRALRRMGVEVKQDVPYLCQTAHHYECGVFSTILKDQ